MNALKQNNELHSSLILQTDISTEEITFPHRCLISSLSSAYNFPIPALEVHDSSVVSLFKITNLVISYG